MSDLTKNIALGSAAVLAGTVAVGAAVLTSSSTSLLGSSGNGGSGGGSTISVTVAELNPSVEITSPAEGDVLLSNNISYTTTFEDSLYVDYTLTNPNNQTCDLGTYANTSFPSSATHTATFDITSCQLGVYGDYTLTASLPGLDTTDSVNFSFSTFSLDSVIFDAHGDPIILTHYGSGIGLITFTAQCGNSSTNILGSDYNYVTEGNADKIDEILLPFANKNVSAGSTCTVEATAKKKNGDHLNSQDVSGATIQKTFTYTGV